MIIFTEFDIQKYIFFHQKIITDKIKSGFAFPAIPYCSKIGKKVQKKKQYLQFQKWPKINFYTSLQIILH